MKRFAGVFFLAVILLNLFGFYISFYASRNEIKAEMANDINQHKAKVQKLVMPVADYNNALTADKNELVVNGQYYDVSEVSFSNGTATVCVAVDNDESNMVKEFVSSLLNNSNESRHSASNTISLKFFQLNFYKPAAFRVLPLAFSQHNLYIPDTGLLTRTVLPAVGPPPDSIMA